MVDKKTDYVISYIINSVQPRKGYNQNRLPKFGNLFT